MKRLIAVSGSSGDDDNLSKFALDSAERVGQYIAEKGGVLICGGRNGIMEAAARGAKRGGGLTIGILPASKEKANKFIDIAIPTYMGYLRNYLLITSADAVIGIAGRWGTLNEISLALNLAKPTVVLKGSGGWADILSRPELTEGYKTRPYVAESAKEAVQIAFSLLDCQPR